jgi:hypothetical protein
MVGVHCLYHFEYTLPVFNFELLGISLLSCTMRMPVSSRRPATHPDVCHYHNPSVFVTIYRVSFALVAHSRPPGGVSSTPTIKMGASCQPSHNPK